MKIQKLTYYYILVTDGKGTEKHDIRYITRDQFRAKEMKHAIKTEIKKHGDSLYSGSKTCDVTIRKCKYALRPTKMYQDKQAYEEVLAFVMNDPKTKKVKSVILAPRLDKKLLLKLHDQHIKHKGTLSMYPIFTEVYFGSGIGNNPQISKELLK